MTGEPVRDLIDWTIAQGLETCDLTALVGGVAERLAALGLPLWRMHLSFPTINPDVRGRNHIWRRDGGAFEETVSHARYDGAYGASPFAAMLADNVFCRRWRFDGSVGVPQFPVMEQLRLEGATEYLAHIKAFSGEAAALPGAAMSFATDLPGGFDDDHAATIAAIVPALALAASRIALLDVTVDVLGAYIGRDAGRHVLSGQIRRGEGHRVTAALMIADLRGFTSATESSGAEIIGRLGEHLAAMAEPVEAAGGEILKFLGDGLLAACSTEEGGAEAACAAMLAAGCEALRRNDAVNAARPGGQRLELDVALHLGEVFYGNVGAGSRLDFTVIGPAVNEAARLESMCGTLGHRLLMSGAFARACGRRALPLGRHRLRGIAEPREIFTLEDAPGQRPDLPDAEAGRGLAGVIAVR